jgi:prepilin-type N-terminal cleavage/methylation domain-containing protein
MNLGDLRFTIYDLRVPGRRNRISDFGFARLKAFTLLELLTVIAIVGIIAAIALPTLHSFKPNAAGVASRQLLDAVTRARQLAISQRSTVFMVFIPPAFASPPLFYRDPNFGVSYTAADMTNALGLLDKQLVGYNYISLRSVGDQPGINYPRYLSSWRTLPAGAFISIEKFTPNNTTTPLPQLTVRTNGLLAYQVFGFNYTNIFPFPSEQTQPATSIGNVKRWISLPYIAFDGMGRLVMGDGSTPAQTEFLPITQGVISYPRDADTKGAIRAAAGLPPLAARDVPSGNTTNNYSLVYIDQLTGRGRIEHQKVQ